MGIKKIKIKTQVLLLVLIVGIAACVFAVVQEYRWGALDYEAMVEDKLTTVLAMSKMMVDEDYHDRIVDIDSVSDEEFNRIVDRNNKLCVELDLQYIWSVMLLNDEIVFTTSTSPDKVVENMQHAKFLEVHTNQGLYLDVIQDGKKVRQHINGKWGEIESVLMPFVDKNGRAYVFGVALDNAKYRGLISDRIEKKLLNDASLLLPIMMLCYVFIRWLVRPLTFITTHIQEVANGAYDYRAKAKWANEYLELADRIHYMYTEINESYNTIQRQEKDLKTTLMSIGDGVIVSDAKGVVKRINNEASNLTGWSEKEGKGKNICEVLQISDTRVCEEERSPFDVVIETAKIVELNRNTMLVSKDKTECHVSGIFSPILDGGNEVTGVVITFKNLTSEDRQAEKIRENHEIMLDVLRLSKIAYWEYYVDQSAFWISKEIVELYGVEEVKEGIIDGHLLAEKYFDNVTYSTFDEIKEAVNNKTTFRSVHEVINARTNKPLFFDAAATPILDSKGEVVKLVGLTKDITEHKSLTHQLYHSQKLDAVGQLAGGVAHDFNNMLGGIIGFTELILNNVKGDKKLEDYCANIINTGENAANLTKQLLSFARKGKAISTPISVHDTIDSALSLLGRSIDRKILIEKELNAQLDTITGDPSQVESIILNLGINARDAIGESGKIIISTELTELSSAFCKISNFDVEPGNYIIIKVIDNGSGMDGETLEHIFEPFFTTKSKGKGTGLGLSVIFGVVTSHRGLINVYSELGKGTEFNIYLPLCGDEEMIEKQNEGPKDSLNGEGCVLLVDDEEVIRAMAVALLEDLGYSVIVAENGQQAVELYKNNIDEIDVVVLDVVMPVMSGMECLENLLGINPDVKAIIASGFSKSENSSDFINVGAVDFIDKPYRQVTLAKSIKSALER